MRLLGHARRGDAAVTGVFNHFTELVSSASGWAYGIVFVLAMLDAFVPVVPSETAVITAGVVAAGGDLSLSLVVVAAAAGAFTGDNVSYVIGREFGHGVVDRFFGGEKGRRRIEWAKRQLAERGVQLILVGRFVPGGRTAVTISAGLLRFHWPRFSGVDAVAALVWAVYSSLLGYFGGRAFEHAPWKGLLIALGIGVALGGVVEIGRRVRRRLT
jgi:membrane protein DedA with SNARE-associated domain